MILKYIKKKHLYVYQSTSIYTSLIKADETFPHLAKNFLTSERKSTVERRAN